MKVQFWGVRGSIPIPGKDTVKFGGNTSCVEVDCDGEIIIFDAGTGIRPLGLDLLKRELKLKKVSVFFSHLHWDHIQGFPYFRPAYNKDFIIDLFGFRHNDIDLESVIQAQMQGPNFPVRFSDMGATITLKEIQKGKVVKLNGIKVENIELYHPDNAYGYKLTYKSKTIVYAVDREHTDESDSLLLSFIKNTDIVIYDAQYTPEEYSGAYGGGGKKGWGHSTWKKGVELARGGDIGKLILFHHGRDDDSLDQIASIAKEEFENTVIAYEGLKVVI